MRSAVTSRGTLEASTLVPMPLVVAVAARKVPCTWWPEVLQVLGLVAAHPISWCDSTA